MALIPGWFPPTREHWELIVYLWQFFPILTAAQWLTDFYPQGKTSITSSLNLPGKYAWLLMEIPGTLTVLYLFTTLPSTLSPALSVRDLPWGNWTMIALYTTHYLYRAVLSPLLLNPSMSPIHLTVFLSAFVWQVINGICIGGWVGGYGPTTVEEWGGREAQCFFGILIWGWAWLGNMFHDDELREIRREAMRRQLKGPTAAGGQANQKSDKKRDESTTTKPDGTTITETADNTIVRPPGNAGSAGSVDKVYMMPKNGLFKLILYPHYLCEWIEWGGFWLLGGWGCVPARTFLFNEIATMLPRSLAGWRWYVRTFGREKVGRRMAIIPGVL